MKIGVSGASGTLGKAVLAELATRAGAHEVIGISRTPDFVGRPAQGRFGDYDRPESLAAAYDGISTLLLIPSADVRPGVRARQGVTAVDVAVLAGVAHIVLLSSAGTRDVPEPHIWASYFAAEQHVMRRLPKWTILRMNYYAEAFVQEARMTLAAGAPLTGLAENRVGFVSRADVAAAAAGILTSDGHAGAIYTATGPQSLSGAERAALAGQFLGAPAAFVEATEDDKRRTLAGMGLPDVVINAAISIQRGFAAGGFDIVTGDVRQLSGRPPRPLAEVISAALRPQPAA